MWIYTMINDHSEDGENLHSDHSEDGMKLHNDNSEDGMKLHNDNSEDGMKLHNDQLSLCLLAIVTVWTGVCSYAISHILQCFFVFF